MGTITIDPAYTFTPSVSDVRGGTVTLVRPLTDADADLWETGPMWLVAHLDGTLAHAYRDELAAFTGDPVPWGDWWDAEDHETSGAVQHFIETGRRQSRRESFEHSVASERARLAAEARARRTGGRMSA